MKTDQDTHSAEASAGTQVAQPRRDPESNERTAPVVSGRHVHKQETDYEVVTEPKVPSRLLQQRRAWQDRPLLRAVYHDAYKRMISELTRDASGNMGMSIELGCGNGFFKAFFPQITSTDVILTPWCDGVADAQNLPFDDQTIRNVVIFDVLHHLPQPGQFFDELVRVLEPGGRAIMLEPYTSPLSSPIYRSFHHEPSVVPGDPLEGQHGLSNEPMDGNNGIPKKIFFTGHGLEQFRSRWPELSIHKRRRLSLWAYPCSGGFTGPTLCPARLGKLVLNLEHLLERPLGWLMAYRCLIVLQRRPLS